MTLRHYYITAFILTLAGLLFSGYLSAIKLFTSSCAFNETCPTFLGYPACWYGFVMYAVMFIVTTVALSRRSTSFSAAYTNLVISIVGILFAGQYAIPEIISLVNGGGVRYTLGLPTCVYGLVFYLAIFIITLIALGSRKERIAY